MDAVEDYARRWIKREVDQDPELESLSDWFRTIRSLVQSRIHKLKNCVNTRPKSVFKDQEKGEWEQSQVKSNHAKLNKNFTFIHENN
jgi:hypothetical protein